MVCALESGERAHPVAQGRLERRDGRQFVAEHEQVERLAAGTDCVIALAEAVFEKGAPRGGRARRRGIHIGIAEPLPVPYLVRHPCDLAQRKCFRRRRF